MPRTAPKQPLVLPDGTRRAMSVDEVADRAGVSKAVVYRAIQNSELRASKLGGVIRILPDTFDAWIAGER